MTETTQATPKVDEVMTTEQQAEIIYPDKTAEVKQETKEEIQQEVKEDKKEDQAQDLELVIPEKSKITEKEVEQVKNFAKEHNLPKDVAQKILDDKISLKDSYVLELQENAKKQSNEWLEQAKNDPEIGKSFGESIELANRALERFAPKELRDALNVSGLGNHPDMIKFAARIGKALHDDKLEAAPKSPVAPKTLEELFYGNNK